MFSSWCTEEKQDTATTAARLYDWSEKLRNSWRSIIFHVTRDTIHSLLSTLHIYDCTLDLTDWNIIMHTCQVAGAEERYFDIDAKKIIPTHIRMWMPPELSQNKLNRCVYSIIRLREHLFTNFVYSHESNLFVSIFMWLWNQKFCKKKEMTCQTFSWVRTKSSECIEMISYNINKLTNNISRYNKFESCRFSWKFHNP